MSLAAAIVLVGSFLQGGVGFGVALVAAPFLVLIDPVFVPGPMLIGSMVLTMLISCRDRRGIDLSGLQWAVIGRIVGTAVGIAVLCAIPKGGLSIFLGSLVLLAVVLSVIGIKIVPNLLNLLWVGTLSGFMGTTSSIGGPPMALLYQDSPGSRLRGTLSAFFVVGTIISLLSLAYAGFLGMRELKAGLVLVPGVVIGFALSGRFARYLDRGMIRHAVLIVSAAAGIAVVVRGIM